MSDPLGDAHPIVKALAAAFAGRALLLLDVSRRAPITLRSVLTVLVWELPLITAFALIGWYAAEDLLGLNTDGSRVVFVAVLANLGARGVDRLLARVLLPASNQARAKPPPPGAP